MSTTVIKKKFRFHILIPPSKHFVNIFINFFLFLFFKNLTVIYQEDLDNLIVVYW